MDDEEYLDEEEDKLSKDQKLRLDVKKQRLLKTKNRYLKDYNEQDVYYSSIDDKKVDKLKNKVQALRRENHLGHDHEENKKY